MDKAALYLRLSREDGEGESGSIKNQRELLMEYARVNSIEVLKIYDDDGYSGLSFERPGFKRMINDIESGHVDTVITKDMSRLGRDYIMTGHYLERYFPSKGVRFIAVNDGIDTNAGVSELMPFKAVFNDLYARDISQKVRGALKARMIKGQFIGAQAPFGYKKEEKN